MKYNLVRSGPRQSSSVVRAPGIYLEAAWGPQFKSPTGPFSATAAGYITRDFSMYGVCQIYLIFFFFKIAHGKVYGTFCNIQRSIPPNICVRTTRVIYACGFENKYRWESDVAVR